MCKNYYKEITHNNMAKGYYKCECGKEFDNPQSFNGHKSHCEIFQIRKWGSLDRKQERDKKFREAAHQANVTKQAKSEEHKNNEVRNWLLSKPRCECCGKVMTEKFRSGRFCSISCANKRTHSNETKNKIGLSLKGSKRCIEQLNLRKERNIEKYYKSPKVCNYCGKQLSFEQRNLKYCSDECRENGTAESSFNKLHRIDTSKHWRGNFKWGTYMGFWCDSSWELAFVMYCLDNGINIIQNHDFFNYQYNGKTHKYTPDFIVDGTYVEIKGYFTDKDREKLIQFPKDKTIKLITNEDAKKYINYAKLTYGVRYFELYDEKFPNWMNYAE